MSTCLQDLYNDIERDIDGELPSLLDGGDADRFISESLDSIIPADNGSLAELLNNHNELASVDDYGMLGEHPSVWDIIARATYESVLEHANKYLQQKKDEFEELKDELEGEGYQTGYEPGVKPRRTYLYLDLDDWKNFPEGVALYPQDVAHPAKYCDELFIKGNFKNDHEAWTWLEENLERVQADITAWKESQL